VIVNDLLRNATSSGKTDRIVWVLPPVTREMDDARVRKRVQDVLHGRPVTDIRIQGGM
jgi:hypothetical protein